MDSKFRTVYITDPRFERNNLRHITAKSKHLKGRADITVFVPEEAHELNQVPLLTLLHGVYGSHLDWPYKAGVHFIADRLIKENKLNPIMIAMPSDGLWGDGSGYITHKNGNDYEKWIVEDVPNAVSETVNFFDRNDSLRFISGLSMGGYGALRIGAKYPAIYKGISAHSSITTLKEMQSFIEEDIATITSEDENSSVIDLMLKNRGHLPALRFDCGTDDNLIEANRLLNNQLTENGIVHEYQEFPGAHEWKYWEKHVEDTLMFCQKHM